MKTYLFCHVSHELTHGTHEQAAHVVVSVPHAWTQGLYFLFLCEYAHVFCMIM
jgi:hypothetical protein